MIVVFDVTGKTVVVVPISIPAQLSMASGAFRLVISHVPLISGNEAIFGIGAMLSISTTFCVCVLTLPERSL